MATVQSSPEQKILLRNVSWKTYEHLLADHESSSAPRFAYDRGMLEIMSPSTEHEEYNRTIALLVEVVAEELSVDVRNVGSMTFRREDLERGFEPDSCFYIQNEEHVGGKAQIDLLVDPPPDLVIEIDITSPSLNKFPIYAQIGVPEIWRYGGERVAIFELQGTRYDEVAQSGALPPLDSVILSSLLEESKTLKRTAWLRKLREWARLHLQP